VDRIYLCGTTPRPGQAGRAGKDLAKTALGAERAVPWEYHCYCSRAVERLRSQKVFLIGLEQNRQAIEITRFNPPKDYALVLGSEIKGVAKRVLARCDKIIYIPMTGKKESLNVSVAFGVAGYFLKFKQRC
jgi:tRNA G18 (ribose-2'-O)-methylase SpoU